MKPKKSPAASLSSSDIDHVASLAKLQLSEKQKQTFLPQLSSVLSYVATVQQLNTDTTEETSQVTGQENVFREDEVDVTRMLSHKQALAAAPRSHNGYFVVQAILQKNKGDHSA